MRVVHGGEKVSQQHGAMQINGFHYILLRFQSASTTRVAGPVNEMSSSSRRVDDNQLSWIDRPPSMGSVCHIHVCNK